jgi:hypothetical protein
MRPDGAELMDRAHTANDRVFIYGYVTAWRGIVRQNTVVANYAIVGDVGVDH